MPRILRSRLGVILVAAAVLLTLDVGRSIWARVALESPSSEYRPDPARYADLTWPRGYRSGRDGAGESAVRRV